MNYRLGLLFLTSLTLATSFENEAAASSRQSQERAARKACLVGDYASGVAILSDLFLDTKNPTYLYNQGRCFEQNSRFEDAISRFEEYLRVAEGNLSEKDKAEAEKHLAACRTKLGKDRQDAVPPPVLQPPPENVPSLGSTANAATQVGLPGTPESQNAIQTRNDLDEPSGHRRGLLTAGIITGVLGAGGITAGILFNLQANKLARDVETVQPGAYSASRENDQKSKVTLSKVAYGAGAACLVAGAILVTLGLRTDSPPSTTVAFSPAVGPEHMGAVLTGAF